MDVYGGITWSEIAALVPRSHDYAWKLYVTEPFRRTYLRAAIDALGLPTGSRGLDAGCGIGLQSMLLADAVGQEGSVTGMDISRELLDCAASITQAGGYSGRIALVEGDICRLPFADDTFDWLWSADCAGCHTRDPLPLVRELARVVRPGGTVALLIHTSQQLLAGYPRLEARLNATASGIAPFTKDMAPEAHYLRALGWFGTAGLDDNRARTFLSEFQAPLDPEVRTALLALVKMRWPGVRAELVPQEWELFRRLCDPASPDFIMDRAGYYAYCAATLFTGRVPTV
ncbi:MAG: methyltransferase domain-containing protein [Actinomycetota bacterium]